MDFVSKHPSLEKGGTEAKRYAEIYQQLGLAWEYLGRQCEHWDGFRKTREGNQACRICGLIEEEIDSSKARTKGKSKKTKLPAVT